MTREIAKSILVSLGIENPTDEQVTTYLNSVNKETKSANDRAEKYKAEADKVVELQKQVDAKLSDEEKANKAKEAADNRIAELEKSLRKMQTEKELATLQIVGEEAEKLFNEDGSLNFQTLGQILTNREKNAATAKEKELAGNAGNPGGQGGSNGGDDEKSEGAIYAERFNAQYAPKGE